MGHHSVSELATVASTHQVGTHADAQVKGVWLTVKPRNPRLRTHAVKADDLLVVVDHSPVVIYVWGCAVTVVDGPRLFVAPLGHFGCVGR
jgi:hypothetical protein